VTNGGKDPTWDGTPQPGPSYGPDWDAAIAYGLDVGLIETSLGMTPAERADRLQHMLFVHASLRNAKVIESGTDAATPLLPKG